MKNFWCSNVVGEKHTTKNAVSWDTNQGVGFDYINQVGKAIGQGNIANAKNILGNWVSNNLVDDNYKRYYNWQINNRGNANPASLADIAYLANLCPFTDGLVVYAARNTYNAITQQNIQFTNSCNMPANSNTAPEASRKAQINQLTSKSINIYPNPSSGAVNINLPISKSKYQIAVVDIFGRTVVRKNVSGNEEKVLLHITNGKGLYLVNITNGDSKTTSKIIIK